jgi:uncharacterized membrane protein
MEPRQLSEELRNGSNPDLNRRRWIIGLSILGTTVAQIVSLYQTGIIKKLPDPPISIFDSDKVDASDYAYKRMNSPDGPGMIASYAVTTMLAAAGGKDRASQSPLLPIAMGAKILGDSVVALKLAQEEWQENKAFCAYCQVATLASVASIVLAAPEVINAVKSLLNREKGPQLAY